jgi:hypothetical protein
MRTPQGIGKLSPILREESLVCCEGGFMDRSNRLPGILDGFVQAVELHLRIALEV